MDSPSRVQRAKHRSIIEYLDKKGLDFETTKRSYIMRSPITNETEPSFYVGRTGKWFNRFHDYSSGYDGDIIDLVCILEGVEVSEALDIILNDRDVGTVDIEPVKLKEKPFCIADYVEDDVNKRALIRRYAKYRGIEKGYVFGKVNMFNTKTREFEQKSALLFPHRSPSMMVTGAKFRLVFEEEKRFTARGRLGMYYLENVIEGEHPTIYVAESETSANSLWSFLKRLKESCIVMSIGGVTSDFVMPYHLAEHYPRKIVIDYDGDESLYRERLKRFEHLNCKDVKIKVNKGQDINTLYKTGMIWDYKDLITGW